MEPKRDAHLRSADFFDTGKFPKMTFKSKRAEAAGPGKVKIVGDLTIRGSRRKSRWTSTGRTPPVKHPRGAMVTGATARPRSTAAISG
jgi:polyisoprenoid-binding protein YceI